MLLFHFAVLWARDTPCILLVFTGTNLAHWWQFWLDLEACAVGVNGFTAKIAASCHLSSDKDDIFPFNLMVASWLQRKTPTGYQFSYNLLVSIWNHWIIVRDIYHNIPLAWNYLILFPCYFVLLINRIASQLIRVWDYREEVIGTTSRSLWLILGEKNVGLAAYSCNITSTVRCDVVMWRWRRLYKGTFW